MRRLAGRRSICMLKKPVMSAVFDIAEASRARKNGLTPFKEEIKVIRDIPYKTAGNTRLVLDLFLPSCPSAEKIPVLLFIPGGGWMIHNRKRRSGYAELFATLGAAVAVIDHRLCPETFFPEDLKDVADALGFLNTLAPRYDLDPDNVTVMGDSSGGHLAALIGCAASDEYFCEKLKIDTPSVKPKLLILISGAFSFEVMYKIPFTHQLIVRYFSGCETKKGFRKWEFYKECDPYNYINKDFPATFNSGGMTDMLCLGEAERMGALLDEKGVDNERFVGRNLFNSGHCFNYRINFKPARICTEKILEWYAKKESELGVDMSGGLKRALAFLHNYRAAIKGRIKC